ncbi:MAG TPA: ABC transporter permease [Polyangiales bacterium]|nr:ABC transporter permease [Polyangiales bacterium]
MSSKWLMGLGSALGAALLLFLALPVFALLVTSSPDKLLAGLRHPITLPALALSVATTSVALGLTVLGGTPLAFWLSRCGGGWARAVEVLVQLPMVIPPAVAGIALLFSFGRRGVFGPLLEGAGFSVAFSAAAVVMAQVFVGAPFYVQAAAAAFASLDAQLLAVARTLGASPARVFFRVALPLARDGLIAGAAMAWARALGEFGATLMFAGNLPGRTQTLPLAIYTALESDLRAAQALSLLLVLFAFALLLVLRSRQRSPGRPR